MDMKNNYKKDKNGLRVGYLKCDYSPGMFNNEYAVIFNARNQKGCFVNIEDVTAIDKKKGYVKVFVLKVGRDEANIWIKDAGDHRLSPFAVPKDDLVARVA